MNRKVIGVSLLLALASAGAWAHAGKVGQILQQQREIRRESETSTGAYVRFDHHALSRMHAAQDHIFRLLDGVSDVGQMPPESQADLFNSLETVKAVLADSEADRQVCTRETRCATLAERERIRQESRQWHSDTSICGQNSTGISCGTDAVGRLGP